MQVADNSQTATSATLGGKATRAVTMVEDASLFMMLSSNLYSNQRLAVVREILCNAWDAHIEAGTIDKPIYVTINENCDLIIMDSGTGIHDDFIEVVYGIYGGSTKKNDTKTTGGFGLGSKSPWAYTESFRVTSEHNGVKTVYNMARTCIENDGKPGILPVVGNLPTDRSGLTVEFRLDENDVDEIDEYIRAIAKHGDMNVRYLNERDHATPTMLERLGMSDEPGSYNLDAEEWHYSYMGNHRIYVRYGAVIYPALRTPGTEKALEVIENFMDVVGYRRILVQAAPSTLALTPSREALSSQKMTENGIVDICVNLVDQIEKEILEQIPDQMEQLRLYISKYDYREMFGNTVDFWSNIRNSVVQRYVRSKLGKDVRTKYYPILWAEMNKGFYNHFKANYPREQARFLIRENNAILNQKKSKYHQAQYLLAQEFSQQYLSKPIGKILAGLKLSAKSLMMVSVGRWNGNIHKNQFGYHLDKLHLVGDMVKRKRIFVTTRVKEITKTIRDYHNNNVSAGKTEMVYKVSNKAGEKDAVIAAFSKQGYEVIDLTANHHWDTVAQDIVDAKRKREAQKKFGVVVEVKAPSVNILFSLANAYNDSNKKVLIGSDVERCINPKHVTEKPLFYFEQNECKTNGKLGDFTYIDFLSLDERLNGIIVRNGIERNMAVKRGAIHGDVYFRDRFVAKVLSPEFAKYKSKLRKPDISYKHYVSSSDLKLLRLLGVTTPGYSKLVFNKELEKYIELLDSCYPQTMWHRGEITPEQADALTEVAKLRLEELPFIKRIKAIKSDRLINRIGNSEQLLKFLTTMPERKSALKSLVLSALKTGKPSDE